MKNGKRQIVLLIMLSLAAVPSFATYIVVMKDGSRYQAKAKYTVVGGKALIRLENGQTLQLDPSLIDERKSDETTALGLGNANVIGMEDRSTAGPSSTQQKPTLGSITHLRHLPQAAADNPQATPTPAPAGGPKVSDDVIRKFGAAYENVGIFEQKITSIGPASVHVDATADNEEKVFNAISATSFLMVHDAGVPGTHLELVELFLKTTNGGSAGRFKMTRADADALDKKLVSHQDYFIRNVIY
jgi:hypothetical protein